MPRGRFAPSPTGRLHLGNLRTALVAWLVAHSDGGDFLLRFEDLDTPSVRHEHYRTHRDDLATLGLGWDGEPVLQSERAHLYQAALDQLSAQGLVYPCFCSRRDIREAVSAPNGPGPEWDGRYPGTCRNLSPTERALRRASRPERPPALRLRSDNTEISTNDLICGRRSDIVDDVVVCRGDGTPAYNLAVVVDDVAQGIEVVVRADDLLRSTATHIRLAELLGGAPPQYAHVPLVLGPDGQRLAKRDGAVTLADRVERGETPAEVLSWLAESLDLCEPGEPVTPSDLLPRFDPARLPTEPWTLSATALA